MDRGFNKSPNMYAFLTDNGVDDSIAEVAQELAMNNLYEVLQDLQDELFYEVQALFEDLQEVSKKVSDRLDDLVNLLE